jgi:Na+/H+-translocating membrane pyrophosphatase
MTQDFNFASTNLFNTITYFIFFSLVIAISIFGFIFIIRLMKKLKKFDNGTPEMQKIHNFIKLGSIAGEYTGEPTTIPSELLSF